MILGLRQISDFVLMLNIDGDDYTYFSLQSKSAGINANALLKALSENRKWSLKGNLMEFTSAEARLGW